MDRNYLYRVLNNSFKVAYFPVVGLQALICGTGVAILHSEFVRKISKIEETNGFSRDSPLERFKEGFSATLNAYGYEKVARRMF